MITIVIVIIVLVAVLIVVVVIVVVVVLHVIIIIIIIMVRASIVSIVELRTAVVNLELHMAQRTTVTGLCVGHHRQSNIKTATECQRARSVDAGLLTIVSIDNEPRAEVALRLRHASAR